MKRVIYLAVMMAFVSCSNKYQSQANTYDVNQKAYIADEDSVVDESTMYQTQAEINEACWSGYDAYKDSVEHEFQKLVEVLPQYRETFLREKDVWEKYQIAVKEVADCEDCGSSTPMYVSDVLSQGTKIRDVPQHRLFLYTQGKELSYSQTTFTPAMIADAYSAYIKAIGEDEYVENKTKYQESLRKEQECWDKLLNCRNENSKLLNDDIKKVYEIGTNQMLRAKLYQLKNQNRDLGMTSGEVMKCALPEDCSDKVLLEYPGFDKVWAKHCENLDWYPTFD